MSDWTPPGGATPPSAGWLPPPSPPPGGPPLPPPGWWPSQPPDGGWPPPPPPPVGPKGSALPVLLIILGVVLIGAVAFVATWNQTTDDVARPLPPDLPLATSPPATIDPTIEVGYEARPDGYRIVWRMAPYEEVSGPRDLLNLPAPTQGTFWSRYQDGPTFGYDAVVIEHASGLGATDAAILEVVVRTLTSDTEVVSFEPSERDGIAVADFHLVSHYPTGDVTFLGRAAAWDGTVFEIAIRSEPPLVPDTRRYLEAAAERDRVWRSVAIQPP